MHFAATVASPSQKERAAAGLQLTTPLLHATKSWGLGFAFIVQFDSWDGDKKRGENGEPSNKDPWLELIQ